MIRYSGFVRRYGKYTACVMAGIVLWAAAESLDAGKLAAESGILKRNHTGQGEAVYELYVRGVEEKEVPVTVAVPEQKLSDAQIRAVLPEAIELLCERIRGDNESLFHVTEDLHLEREIPEYGIAVKWESEAPELISNLGTVDQTEIPPEGKTVYLTAELSSGSCSEQLEIPVTLFPKDRTAAERFRETIEAVVLQAETEEVVRLPNEFEGKRLEYRSRSSEENRGLILLGIFAAGCLAVKERSDKKKQKQLRTESLIRDYPDLVSKFIVLTGAGYPVKQAWRKQTEDYRRQTGREKKKHPLYEEMQITLNQMDTGMPEVQAYGEFGRRLGLRCYVKFASLLESCVHTGGKDFRRLLEDEMEEAFRQRTDLAEREGEEASAKLLIPMFLILGVVMIMVTAPAFLVMG